MTTSSNGNEKADSRPLPDVDDVELVRLARTPESDVFPLLRKARAMTPLLVLLACLPGVYALSQFTLTDADADFALQAIQHYGSDGSQERASVIEPTRQSHFWTRPLTTWMTAASLKQSPFRPAVRIALPSYFGAVALVFAGFWFCKRLFDLRVALVFAVYFALSGSLVAMIQQVESSTWALASAAAALACLLEHCQRSSSAYSMYLFMAGVIAGLGMLVGGPIALAVLAVQMVCILSRVRRKHVEKPVLRIARSRQIEPKVALASMGLLVLIVAISGGWWLAYQSQLHGGHFWTVWLSGVDHPLAQNEAGSSSLAALIGSVSLELLGKLGALVGLSALGLFELSHRALSVKAAARGIEKEDSATEASQASRKDAIRENVAARTLIAWFVIGLALWIGAARNCEAAPHICRLWLQFVFFACVVLAAYGTECIIQRNASTLEVIAVIVATISARLVMFEIQPIDTTTNLSIPVTVTGALLICWLIWRNHGLSFHRSPARPSGHDTLPLRMTILIIALWNAFSAIEESRSQAADTFLSDYYDRLCRIHDVDRITLVTPHSPPPQLRLVLHILDRESPVHHEPNWSRVGVDLIESTAKPRLLIGWGVRPQEPSDAPSELSMIETAYPPTFLQDRILRTYLVSFESPSETSLINQTDAL
ncbi:MAG: hypothetical protein CMJ78_20480 [Planctomycetaceae bacterium]|nr:hypothetical protein [Planctomycetaceae bacterium]